MLRTLATATAAVATLAAAVAPAGAARPRSQVVSAYLYFAKERDPRIAKFQAGNVELVFRTDRALKLDRDGTAAGGATLAGIGQYVYTISEALHCYGIRRFVNTNGTISDGPDRSARVLPGDRVRAQVGGFSRRFVVQPRRAGYPLGAAIGCGADPKAQAVLYNLTDQPKVEPDRYFLTANAGPYVRNLRWMGWGSDHAAAHGTYVSDCASCGPREVRKATIVLTRRVFCPSYGGDVYRYGRLVTRAPDGTVRRSAIPTGFSVC
jgi:hypothetical protein